MKKLISVKEVREMYTFPQSSVYRRASTRQIPSPRVLANDFYDEVTVKVRVKHEYVTKFEPLVRSFAEYQKAHVEATGSFATLDFKNPASTTQERHVFKKNGNGWLIDFEGEIIPFEKNLLGIQYVYQLILQKNKSIRPLELVRAIEGNRFTGGLEHIDNGEEGSFQPLYDTEEFGGNVDDVIDLSTINVCKKRLRELEADIMEAERNNDLAQQEIAVTEKEEIVSYLSRNTNIKGRPRKDNKEEAARKAVTKRIKAFKESIDKYKKTSDHFNCLSTGGFISYDPKGIDWEWDLCSQAQ
jgi:hypothetical protein